MNADRPLLGVFMMLGFCVLAPMGDAMAKIIGGSIPVGQLVLVRFAVQAMILLPIVWMSGMSLRLSPRAIRLTVTRTVLHIIGIGAMFSALQFLPLADAVAIAFVMPFIMLILGRFVLDEEVGGRRIAACAVGFVGTMLVVQPSFAEVGAPALLPLLVAVVFALFMLVTRQVAKEADPIALQCVSGVVAVAILTPVLLITDQFDAPVLNFKTPTSYEWMLLAGIGALGTFAHLMMTWSLRFAPSATLAPMQYLEIPIATFIGWVVFHDLPNGLAAVGIVITMAAGLYIIYREQITARAGRT